MNVVIGIGKWLRRVGGWCLRIVRTPEPLTLHDLIGPPAYKITQPGKRKQAMRMWRRSARVYINMRKVG